MASSQLSISDNVAWTKSYYTVYLSPWGAGSLTQGIDYTDTALIDPDSFPNNTVLSWSYPSVAASSVYNFDAVSFGDYYYTSPQNSVQSTAVNNITSLSETFNLSLSGSLANFDIITDWFLTSKAGDDSTHAYEIEVFLHTPQYSIDWVNTLPTIGTFAGSGHTWKVAVSYGAVPDIIFMPTDTNDVLMGTIDLKAMMDYLVANHVLTGSEYFNGLAVGAEVRQGSGSLTVNDLEVSYNQPTEPLPTVDITSAGGLTKTLAVTIKGDMTSADAGSVIHILDGSTEIGTAIVSSTGAWTAAVNLTNQQGAHSITAIGANQSGSAVSDAITYTVDTVAPVVLFAGATVTGLTNKTSDVVSLTAFDATSGVRSIEIYDGNKDLGAAKLTSAGLWSFTASGLADGSHSFSAVATDAAGNAASALSIGTVTVDTKPPVTGIDDASRSTIGITTIKGHTEAGAFVSVMDGGKLIGQSTADASGNWSYASIAISSASSHTFTATAIDQAGNVGKTSNELVLGTTGNDRLKDTSPGVVFSGGGGSDTFTGGGGSDAFVFHPNFGKDTITNFKLGGIGGANHDVLEFDHTIGALAAITSDKALAAFMLSAAHVQDTSAGALISVDANNSVLLQNIHKAQLSALDFHLI